MRAVRHQLRVLASQVLVVEDLALFTGDEARLALHTRDQAAAVSGHGEARERPELGGLSVGRHLGGALEADDRCGIRVRF